MTLKAEEKKREEMQPHLSVLRFLSDSTDDYLFSWNFQLNRVYFPSPIWKRYDILGPGENFCTVEDWCKIVYEKDLPRVQAEFDKLRSGALKWHNIDYRVVDRSGNRVWISCRGQCQLDEQGKPIRLIGRISDTILTGEVDSLTNAFTASRLHKDMRAILEAGTPCYLVLLGVDNLKNINIHYGREHGNHLLRKVADTLEKCLDAGGRVYRLNGDCFAVNLPNAQVQDVQAFYEQVQALLEEGCTVSAGAVSYDSHPHKDSNALYQYAEEALDRSKRLGKNTLSFFSQEDYEKKLSTIELQEEIRQSILDGFQGFSLCYQPQIRSSGYDVFGAEALLRFHSPTRGSVSPQDFIPLLEQTGMICQVGLWVLKTAVDQCQAWRASIPDMHISVNISYVQMDQEDIDQQVLDVLEESGLPGEALTLEVTESMQLQDYSRFNKIFYRWKQAGIEISVDDFGTGYSSLSYLKRMDIDEVKIDRCFVSGIQHSAYNFRLLSNMVELAHTSQIRVCCEGVETREELAALEKLHPDLLQGFLFHKPYTREQFEACFLCEETPQHAAWKDFLKELCGEHCQAESFPQEMTSSEERLKTILDVMDEIIYVSDVDTHELYYLNPAGRRLTGIYDYQGRKCYKVLQGKDDPCDFCTNDHLKRDSFYVWELDNKLLNSHFILKDKLIPWGGKLARLEIAIDVTEHEMVSQRVREKLDFAQSVLACAQALTEEPDLHRAAIRMLQLVGEFYQADRAYIFEPDELDAAVWNNAYEWVRPGIRSEQAFLQRIPGAPMQRWLDTFQERKAMVIPNVEDLRETFPGEWKILHPQGIRRLLAFPIWRGQTMTGFMGVDNPTHCMTDDRMMQMLSLFLVTRFQRSQTEERLGELLNLHYRDVLKSTSLGLWVLHLDPQGDQNALFADETMRRVLGLEEPLSPQACYQYWYDRIKDGYYPYVHESVKKMAESGRVVELEYPWEHPTMGEVIVRCTGIRGEDAQGRICLEGYHRIVSGMECPGYLSNIEAGEVFEYNQKTGSIYFHTKRILLAGDQAYEEHFPQCWLDKKMVHPHFAKRFAELLTDIAHSQALDNQEILLRSKTGNYEWYKLRIRHLGEGRQNPDSVMVLLDTADPERVLQLENMRIRDFYHASLSEAIAYAEIDLESCQIRAAGGLWAGYENRPMEKQESIMHFLVRQAGDQVQFLEKLPLDDWTNNNWKDLLSGQSGTQRLHYKRLLDGEWNWVKLVAHTFRERFTNNAYALLYLKNIDYQTRRELAHRNAARRDPLTNVYNRTTFRSEVEAYMTTPGETREGVLILVDVDDFKRINDRFSHIEGDNALKRVTALLKKTFRNDDLIGRLGGDEFMVFLKGAMQRGILEKRLHVFMEALLEDEKEPITCSVGIAYVNSQDFSFDESVCLADAALYKSKKTGKNNYSYSDESGLIC